MYRMSLPQPRLDDKNFQELLEDAKKLIPIYDPEWTDYNIHDPGITFIELFAWLVEMQIYRLDLVSEKNRLKFLKMLGERTKPATPAITDVTFSNKSKSPIIIPQNTQLATITPEQPSEIIFETLKEINVIPQEIIKIESQDSYEITDNTFANGMEGHYYYAFGKTAGKDSTLTLEFNDKLLPVKLDIMVNLHEKDLIEIGSHGEELPEIYPSTKLKWEYKNKNGKWVKLKEEDETFQFTFSGSVSLQIRGSPSEIRCRVEEEGYEIPPRIESISLNTVKAIQKEQVKGENGNGLDVGVSNGLPNQTFCLPPPPSKSSKTLKGEEWCTTQITENLVMEKSTRICTIYNDQKFEWVEVPDFAASKENDLHFMVDLDNGIIRFGDGIHGMIPPAEHQITTTYTHIDGEKGNVAAKQINLILDDDIENIELTNEKPASGGFNSETIEDAIIRVRKDLRTPYTAVTSHDYEELAKSTPGLRVRRAKALADKNYNTVTVLVVPESIPENTSSKPGASDGFLKTVCNHLDKHRLITTQIKTENPKYVKITVNATIKPQTGYDEKIMNKRAVETLNKFLNPFTGYTGDGWPFGRNVFRSEIYEVLDEVEGVDCVFNVNLTNSGHKIDGEKLVIDENELVYSGKHNITILGPGEECGRGKYQ